MNAVPVVVAGLVLLAGFGYTAYTSNQAETEALAKSLNVVDSEKSAFFACRRHMVGKVAFFRSGDTSLSVVPPEICACQAHAMVAVFKQDSYTGHGNIVDFIASSDSQPELPELDRSDLRPGLGSQESVVRQLSKTLLSCHAKYEKEFEADQLEARRKVCASKSNSKELIARLCSG
jgi:hypothetical protein